MEGESVDFGLLNSQGGGRCQVNVSLIYWEKKKMTRVVENERFQRRRVGFKEEEEFSLVHV